MASVSVILIGTGDPELRHAGRPGRRELHARYERALSPRTATQERTGAPRRVGPHGRAKAQCPEGRRPTLEGRLQMRECVTAGQAPDDGDRRDDVQFPAVGGAVGDRAWRSEGGFDAGSRPRTTFRSSLATVARAVAQAAHELTIDRATGRRDLEFDAQPGGSGCPRRADDAPHHATGPALPGMRNCSQRPHPPQNRLHEHAALVDVARDLENSSSTVLCPPQRPSSLDRRARRPHLRIVGGGEAGPHKPSPGNSLSLIVGRDSS